MPGLYTGASGLWGGFAGLLYGSSALSTPPGLLADAGGFTPASLFAQGEQGVWYDPSDMTTLFQDAAGTTPVTAVEQPVGRILDKSGRGNHASQSTPTARPVLSARYNLLVGTVTLATQSVTTVATTYVLAFSGAGSITLSGTATGTYSAGSNSITCTAGTLTLTVSGTVTSADLRVSNDGVGLPAYQRVNTSTDYDTAGFPMYLRFDGTDDCLDMPLGISTLNLNIWAGARETGSVSANSRVMFIGDSTGSINNLSLIINGAAPASNAVGYRFPENDPVFLGMTTNDTVVVSYQRSSTTLQSARRNGANLTNNTNTTTTFTSTTGRVGCVLFSSTSSLFLNGRIYSLIVRGAASSASQISDTEGWVNSRTKAYS